MNKKIIVSSLVIMAGLTSLTSVDAYRGLNNSDSSEMKCQERGMKNRGNHKMTQEMYDKVRALMIKYDKVEDFKEAKKALKLEHKEKRSQKKEERAAMKEKVNKSFEKIDNGIIITVSSDDAAVVEKLQNKKHRELKNNKITRVIENISNGIKVTITAENEYLIERIQNKEKRMQKRMQKKGSRQSNLRFQKRFN